MTNTTNTYVIPVVAKKELEKKLETLSKKAKKYGSNLTWKFGDEFVATRNLYVEADYKLIHTGTDNVFACELTIESEIIKKNGYTVVCEIEHDHNGNIVKMFEDAPADLNWYTMPGHCEHCHTNRDRKYTFIVRDMQGNCKQVGKSCLKDYCGIDPQMIGAVAELKDSIAHEYDIDDFDFGSHRGERACNVKDCIALAYDIIKKNGYVKSNNPDSTRDNLFLAIGKEPSKEGLKIADEITDFLTKTDYSELPDFLQNVKSMVQAEYTRITNLGYIAYTPVAYENMMKKLKERNDNKESDFIGTVGDKITTDIADMKLISSCETMYGRTYIYKFLDLNGNVLMWFGSKYVEQASNKITATIKEHCEYNGVKQTLLKRVKFA